MKNKEKGAISVTGIVVIVAITVILAGILYIWVSNTMQSGGLGKERTPSDIFMMKNSTENITDNRTTEGVASLTIEEGEPKVSDLELLISQDGDSFSEGEIPSETEIDQEEEATVEETPPIDEPQSEELPPGEEQEPLPEEDNEWNTYTDELFLFRIDYPPQFQPSEMSGITRAVSFGNPGESPYLIITVMNNPRGYSIEEFYNFYSNPENVEVTLEEIGIPVCPYYEAADLIEPAEIAGTPAMKFSLFEAGIVTVAVSHNGVIYEIQSMAEGEEIYIRMLDSLDF